MSCWGINYAGQVGVGALGTIATPTPVPCSPLVSKIGLSFDESCALSTTGDVYCWGNGRNGKLGTGDSGA